jgi:hypothetical protein
LWLYLVLRADGSMSKAGGPANRVRFADTGENGQANVALIPE